MERHLALVLCAALVACGNPTTPPGAAGSAAPQRPVAATAPGVQPAPLLARTIQAQAIQVQTVQASSPPAPARRPALTSDELARQRELEHQLASDPSPTRRREAIDQYATGQADGRPLLDSVFSEPDPVVRRWAAMALVREARPEQAQALRQAIPAERDPTIKRILEQALRAAELRGP